MFFIELFEYICNNLPESNVLIKLTTPDKKHETVKNY